MQDKCVLKLRLIIIVSLCDDLERQWLINKNKLEPHIVQPYNQVYVIYLFLFICIDLKYML